MLQKSLIWKAVFKKNLPVGGGPPTSTSTRLIRPADQVQFYDLALHSKRLPTSIPQDWPKLNIMHKGNYHLICVNPCNLHCLHNWKNLIQATKYVCIMKNCMFEVLSKHSFFHRHYEIRPLVINSQFPEQITDPGNTFTTSCTLVTSLNDASTVLNSVIASCLYAHVMFFPLPWWFRHSPTPWELWIWR